MRPAFASLLVPLALAPLSARAAGPDWQACQRAGTVAERQFDLPPGLLLAIGKVESGRGGPGGAAAPWPWTIDARGQGSFFASRDQAVQATRSLLAAGVGSIDVGCFQVNLHYHPQAFASLEEAFDPLANALYAAGFLRALHARLGSWPQAVAAYHSSTPALGLPYGERVLASWKGGEAKPVPAAVAFGVRVNTPAPAGSAPQVIVLRPLPGLPSVFAGRS